jgi:hypothetical protein
VSEDVSGDRELEQLLADSAALRRGYRAASQEEPPAALDAAIRAAARRETRTRPRPVGSAFAVSWRIPASIAAVVVVSVTVTVMVTQRHAHLPVASEQSAPAPAAGARPARDEAAAAAASGAPKEGKDDVGTRKAGLQARPQAARPPAPHGVPPEAPVGKLERPASPGADTPITPATVELRQQPSPVQAEAEQKAASSTTAPPASASANATTPARLAPAVRPAGAAATADETMSARSLAKKQGLPGTAEADLRAAAWERDPQAWLAHVEELRAAGRTEDAEASFRAFRRRYPDYRLPAGFVAPGR